MVERTLIFTILYHRLEMLRLSSLNVLTHAKNARYVLWDNSEDDSLRAYCDELTRQTLNSEVEVVYVKSKNIGLNAAKKVVDEYSDGCKFIMSLDEDILFLPMHFQSTLQAILNHSGPAPMGYVACNVFQDNLTNGARFPESHYRELLLGPHRLMLGPCGGWATMTRKDVYDKVGGYEERPELFFGLDGIYSGKLTKAGYYQGIAKDVTCYHATGPIWNNYFKYGSIHDLKMSHYEKSKK